LRTHAHKEKRFFIATFVADGPCQRSIEDLTELTFYRLDERFSGLEILSEATGRYIAAYLHRDGKRIPVGLIPRDRAQSLGIDSARAVSTLHLGTDRMMLESYAYNSEWGGGDWQVCPGTGGAHNFVNGICSACNMLLPTDVYPDYCGRCGQLESQCVCCPVCHNFPCSCSHGGGGEQGEIITCTKPGCPDPYHCNGTCGGGAGGVDVSVSSLKTRAGDIQRAAKVAVQEVTKRFGKSEPFCNWGVKLAFMELANNSTELEDKRANAMIEYWQNNPERWVRLTSVDLVQKMANSGWFVVAGWKASEGAGHVVVIVPGTLHWASGAKMYVPECMDTGRNMRVEKQPMNKSFGKNKLPDVEFYYYK
jgi:hypothetical protein